MTDREERGKDVSSRLSKRFQNDENDESEMQSQPAESAKQAPGDQPDESNEGDETDESELNVKEEWTGRYMYLPPEIDDGFDNEFDRLVYECGRDLDWKPKKNKHYYPVAVSRGIDAVAEMGPGEFREAVVDLELPVRDG